HTRPNEEQVSSLIENDVNDVAAAVGREILEPLWVAAQTVVTYRTAMLVELSYFPEQVAQGRSPYEHLRDLYEDSLANLVARVNDPTPGEGPGVPSPPSYAFPV